MLPPATYVLPAELSLELGHLPVRLIYYCLKRSRINLKQELTLLNKRALLEILPQQVTSYLRFNFRVNHSVSSANPFFVDRHVLLFDGNYFDFERSRSASRFIRTCETGGLPRR